MYHETCDFVIVVIMRNTYVPAHCLCLTSTMFGCDSLLSSETSSGTRPNSGSSIQQSRNTFCFLMNFVTTCPGGTQGGTTSHQSAQQIGGVSEQIIQFNV